jgi:flagellar motor switch protein FliM
MPTLEIINERFARLLRVGLFNFLRRSAEVSVGSVRCPSIRNSSATWWCRPT